MPSCFIIMPISTPEPLAQKYADPHHFEHVLEHLFKPAVQEAGYTPIPPTAKGADLIHAEIIKNIESADLVLCDMSTLNPNVFFEFGIRTAVNKPVCVVKDDKTDKIPFDTGIINYHQYASELRLWNAASETKTLAEHIKESAKRSGAENMLWKYFGLKNRVVLAEGKGNEQDKLDLLALQLDSLRRKVDEIGQYDPFRGWLAASPDMQLKALANMSPEQYETLESYLKRANGWRPLSSLTAAERAGLDLKFGPVDTGNEVR